jgi:hypothetical protein
VTIRSTEITCDATSCRKFREPEVFLRSGKAV